MLTLAVFRDVGDIIEITIKEINNSGVKAITKTDTTREDPEGVAARFVCANGRSCVLKNDFRLFADGDFVGKVGGVFR